APGDVEMIGTGVDVEGQRDATSDTNNKPLTLTAHFDEIVNLLERQNELREEFSNWRSRTRSNGLHAGALIKLGREHSPTEDPRRRAADAAEVERLYRQGLDLPLLAWEGA